MASLSVGNNVACASWWMSFEPLDIDESDSLMTYEDVRIVARRAVSRVERSMPPQRRFYSNKLAENGIEHILVPPCYQHFIPKQYNG